MLKKMFLTVTFKREEKSDEKENATEKIEEEK